MHWCAEGYIVPQGP